MRDELKVLCELEGAIADPVGCFVRDDDAGWDDAAQLALLDVTMSAGVPVDLAAIPAAVSDRLAKELRSRMSDRPALIGIHQHGARHVDHQRTGRKCEFGTARAAHLQRDDLTWGRSRLTDHFGAWLDPFFTPPWNRCSEVTPALLRDLGYAALSRDRSAPAQTAMVEIPVDVDWCKHWSAGGLAAVTNVISEALRYCADRQVCFGLMLHHAVMTCDERFALRQVIAALGEVPQLEWRLLRQIVIGAPEARRGSTAANYGGGA